jgi:hypothetical protein
MVSDVSLENVNCTRLGICCQYEGARWPGIHLRQDVLVLGLVPSLSVPCSEWRDMVRGYMLPVYSSNVSHDLLNIPERQC